MSGHGELTPGSEFGGYRIESLLGRGGMSVVYLAEHLQLERKVAIKVLAPTLAEDERFRDRFVRESRMAASLDHPNVIPIYEAGEADGRLFIAMRYVQGTDLKGLVREFGPLEPRVALSILRQVAGALDAAHAKGLVHRDVKPANILIAQTARGETANSHVYLSDFGLTRRSSSDSGLTGTGQFVGTLDYAAPEQFEGKAPDPRTDVYSLGCVLFEMLSGHPPYSADFDAALMFAHLSEAPPKATADRPDLPPALDDVISRAMAKSPDQRYQSAGDLATDAAVALGFESTEHAVPPPPPMPPTGSTKRSKRAQSDVGGRRPARRRVAVITGVLVVVVALLAVLLPSILGSGGGGEAEAATPAGMTLISAATGEQQAFIPLSKVQTPAEVIWADGSYWVLNLDPLQFVEVSATTGKVLREISSPFDDVGYFAIADGIMYVTQFSGNGIARIQLSRGRQLQPNWTIDEEEFGLGWPLVVDGKLWVGSQSGSVYELDSLGKVSNTVAPLPSSFELVFSEGFVWASGGDRMARIDPDTHKGVAIDAPAGTGYLAAGGGFVWTADERKGEVYQINPAGAVVDTYATGAGARALSFADDTVWVGNQDDGTVTAIDSLTGQTRDYAFGHPLQSVAAGSGTVLVQLNPGRTYEDRIEALQGNVARLLVDPYQVETDPVLTSGLLGIEVANATCAPLFGYADAEGADGATLQPEVASDVEVEGAVYRFTISEGFRFSPPSDEAVSAETFRFSIERALSPAFGDQAAGAFLVSDIKGEDAFRAGDAEHISGLQASGNTLTITLIAPSPDFLERITMPVFCPVPTDSAMVPNGVSKTLPGAAGRQMAPAAGPYYLADLFPGEYGILKANPNYGGSRPRGFDTIALREGIDPGQAVERVRDGSWDGIIHIHDPLLAPGGPVARRFSEPAAGEPTYTAVPVGLFTEYLEFNASKGHPFADPDLRRAVAYALDRPAIAEAYGGAFPSGVVPFAGMVAPNFPDMPEMPFPTDGPDLATARELIGDRTLPRVVMPVATGCDFCRRLDDEVAKQLTALGFDVQTVEVPDIYGAIHDHPDKYDLAGGGSSPDWPDVPSYLPILFGTYVQTTWLPPEVADAADSLAAAGDDERDAQANAFLAGPVADLVPATGVAYGVSGTLLSARLGCRIFPPFGFGVDLVALCPAAGDASSSPTA